MRPDTRSTTRGNDRDTEITHRMVAPEVGDDSTTSAAHMTSDKASEAADAAVEAARAVVTAPLADDGDSDEQQREAHAKTEGRDDEVDDKGATDDKNNYPSEWRTAAAAVKRAAELAAEVEWLRAEIEKPHARKAAGAESQKTVVKTEPTDAASPDNNMLKQKLKAAHDANKAKHVCVARLDEETGQYDDDGIIHF